MEDSSFSKSRPNFAFIIQMHVFYEDEGKKILKILGA